MLSQKQIQHFFLRTGFGIKPDELSKLRGIDKNVLVERAFESSKAIKPIKHLENPVEHHEASNLKVLKMMLKSKKKTAEVSTAWVKQMAESESQLREKMTFFWHDHFATKVPFAYLMQEQNNTLRNHALGSFKDMIHAMAKDPAMLIFLNNQQNKRRKPNENFAREVMELFTLGEGNYTEQDIKEAARAFTGWQVNRKGEFEVSIKHHDHGSKTVLGKTGNFSGEDVLDILLSNRLCAEYICRKLYRFLVHHEDKEPFIQQMTDVFFNSGYEIGELLRFVLRSDEFYKAEHIGTRIASPVELIVRHIRLLDLNFLNDRAILIALKTLGQVPLFPPNVSGWVEQRSWIDSNTLLFRMSLPFLILKDTAGKSRRLKATSNWNPLIRLGGTKTSLQIAGHFVDHLIQCDTEMVDLQNLVSQSRGGTSEERIKILTINIMSLPEFQLI